MIRLRITIAAVAMCLSCILYVPSGLHAQDAPRIEPGMVLEVYAIGVPQFRYRVAVTPDGEAAFPLLAPMNVAGKTLVEMRDTVRTQLATRVYRQRTVDGAESLINFLPEEIVVEIVEYPSVFVTGDVTSPGEIRFRPTLNVREAIALAGGISPLRSITGNPITEAVDIRGEYVGALIEHASIQAERLGIEAMLSGRQLEGLKDKLEAPLSEAILEDISNTEMLRVELLQAEVENERAHIVDLIESTEAELRELVGERDYLRTRLSEQEEVMAQFREGVERGVISASRFAEEQRHAEHMQERLFSTSTRISAMSREIDTLQRRHEAVAAQHRSDMLVGLRETGTRLRTVEARLETLQEKMATVGAAGGSGLADRRLAIVVHRRGGGSAETTTGDNDTLLRSGDVVEVTVQRPSWGRPGSGL
jgi:polysaccharide biosynthesis/export protein